MIRVLLLLLLTACADGPGDPCTATGDGFTRTDSCRGPFSRDGTCVTWEVSCADGSSATPDVCAGDVCATTADCASGQDCARIDATDRRCLPQAVCPGGFAP